MPIREEKILIQDQVTQKRSYLTINKKQAKEVIRRAIAVFGLGVIPERVSKDLELHGMLSFMSAGKNEANHYNQIAKRICSKQ